MKLLLIIISTLIALPLAALILLNLTVEKRLDTEIIIDAPANEVWETLMDFQGHSEWNPFIRKIKGSGTVGDFLDVTIQGPGSDPMNFAPLVLVNQENKEFRWIGKLGIKGIADGEHWFILEPENSQQTRLVHGEQFSGLLAGLLMKMMGENTHQGFEEMNQALKQRVEQ